MARYVPFLCLFMGILVHAEMPTNDTCMTEVWTRPHTHVWMRECLPTLLDNSLGAEKESYNLPRLILNWGSNGLLGAPWHFNDPHCDVFIKSLFETISLGHDEIHLTPHDLFHAHMLTYEHENASHLAMVFHAKEYPRSLAGIKNFYRPLEEEFDVNDEEFEHRNFLFLSHLGTIYRVNTNGACTDLFSGVNYLSEEKVAQTLPKGHWIGDVNYFRAETLSRIKYRFFSGFSSYLDTDTSDLEAMLTGKTKSDRIAFNLEFDRFFEALKSSSFLYFLTGVKQF